MEYLNKKQIYKYVILDFSFDYVIVEHNNY